MNRGKHDVIEKQRVAPKQPIQCSYGKVTQMLMIDRVKFAAIDEVNHVRHLYDGHACVFQYNPNAFYKTVKIWNMGQYIIGEKDVSNAPFFSELPGKVFTKKCTASWDSR